MYTKISVTIYGRHNNLYKNLCLPLYQKNGVIQTSLMDDWVFLAPDLVKGHFISFSVKFSLYQLFIHFFMASMSISKSFVLLLKDLAHMIKYSFLSLFFHITFFAFSLSFSTSFFAST